MKITILKIKKILLLCGLTLLMGQAFSATGNDDNPPMTPRTQARFEAYPKFIHDVGELGIFNGFIKNKVERFIKTYFPQGIDAKGLGELQERLSNPENKFSRSVKESVQSILDAYHQKITRTSEKESSSSVKTARTRKIGMSEGEKVFKLSPPPLHRMKHSKALERSEVVSEPPLATIPELIEFLNQSIIGQEDAVASLVTGIHRHETRLKVNEKLGQEGKHERVLKQNILICGPTGCGKTASVTTIAKKLGRIFHVADSSGFTRTGYKGDSVSSVIVGLINEADQKTKGLSFDTAFERMKKVSELAQNGIVFLDEIDKIACKSTGERDIAGADVQAELLKLMEGKEVALKVDGVDYKIDTTNILFIGGGAFSGVKPDNGSFPAEDDFVSAGFKPELLGRFGRKVFFEGMNPEKFLKILESEEASPIKQNLLLLEMGYNFSVNFDDEAMLHIAEQAHIMQTGVRGLQTLVGEAIDPLIKKSHEHQGKKVLINKVFLEKNLRKIEPKKPKIVETTEEDPFDRHMRLHPNGYEGMYV